MNLFGSTTGARAVRFGLTAILMLVSSASEAAASSVILPGDHVFPESITSTSDGTLYVGSIEAGGIFRVPRGALRAVPWIKPGALGSRSIMGVLADERSGTLWACSNDLSAMGIGVSIPGKGSGSWLEGFDLKTGEGKISVKLPGERAFCNDMAVGRDGSVYVTDSAAPDILKLSADHKHLEVWATDPRFQPPAGGVGLDGIAFGGNDRLYVNTYMAGEFFRVGITDGKPGKITRLKTSRRLILPDGLRPLGEDSFLLIEGGGRLDHAVVNGDTVTIQTIRGGFSTPTGVTLVDKKVAWVSEGQLSYLFDPQKKGQKPRLPFRIYAVPLTTHR